MPPLWAEAMPAGRCPWKQLLQSDVPDHAQVAPAAATTPAEDAGIEIPRELRKMIAMMGSGRGPFVAWQDPTSDIPAIGRPKKRPNKIFRNSFSTNYQHLAEI